MVQLKKSGAARDSLADQQMRDQEVVRANRELAAYFKGRRTEREARAALKIIKAFVRDRERRNPDSRPPLPGAARVKAPAKGTAPRKAAPAHRRRRRREPRLGRPNPRPPAPQRSRRRSSKLDSRRELQLPRRPAATGWPKSGDETVPTYAV